MTDKKVEQDATPKADAGAKNPKVVWDDANMKTSYANVVNATSTREEVTIFFGIVLNPYAAKRLWTLMGAVLKEYESRYGDLDLRDTGTKAGNT